MRTSFAAFILSFGIATVANADNFSTFMRGVVVAAIDETDEIDETWAFYKE